MPRALLPWLAPTPAPSAPSPAPVQEPARVDRWVAPTPEVVVARKTNVRRAHAARTSRKPRGGDRHAADAPATLDLVVEQLDVTVEQPEPTPVPIEQERREDPSHADDHGRFGLESGTAGEGPPVVVSPLSPALVALVRRDTTPDDLRRDQALPPMFRVLGRDGETLGEFHGCEHATHANHVWPGTRGVIRIADGKRMMERR